MAGLDSKRTAALDKLAEVTEEKGMYKETVSKDEALELALEALESGVDTQIGLVAWTEYDSCLISDAITAVKKALAQPAQEPVAFAVVGEGKFGIYEIGKETETDLSVCKYWENRGYTLIPLYTTPPQRPWVGLTMEEFLYILDNCRTPSTYLSMVEAKLKEKNS